MRPTCGTTCNQGCFKVHLNWNGVSGVVRGGPGVMCLPVDCAPCCKNLAMPLNGAAELSVP